MVCLVTPAMADSSVGDRPVGQQRRKRFSTPWIAYQGGNAGDVRAVFDGSTLNEPLH